MWGAVVGFESSAIFELRTPKFNACDVGGEAVFYAKVYYAHFGFRCGGDNHFDGLEKYVDVAVDSVFIFPSEAVDGGCTALCLGEDKELGICYNLEDHFTGVVAHDAFRVSVKVLH